MKRGYWQTVYAVVKDSDIILYVLDFRFPEESRNAAVEELLIKKGKPFIGVFSKCDLAGRDLRGRDVRNSVAVSSKTGFGIRRLKQRIRMVAKKLGISRAKVGVLGYPNIGKSSLINALAGRAAARISKEPGMTRGMQYISSGSFLLIDTPGVVPKGEAGDLSHIRMSVQSANISEADIEAVRLLSEKEGVVESYFGVPSGDDKEAVLEDIALKRHFILKGGRPDVQRAARIVLKLYQEGKF